MISNEYMSIRSGTMCHYPTPIDHDCIPALFTTATDLFVRKDLRTYPISHLVRMYSVCLHCKNYVLDAQTHKCEPNAFENCKYCCKAKDHSHNLMKLNAFPKYNDFVSLTESPFSTRINNSMFYLLKLEGEVQTTDCQIMADALSTLTRDDDTTFFYNLPTGVYCVFSGLHGQIRTPQVRYGYSGNICSNFDHNRTKKDLDFVDFSVIENRRVRFMSKNLLPKSDSVVGFSDHCDVYDPEHSRKKSYFYDRSSPVVTFLEPFIAHVSVPMMDKNMIDMGEEQAESEDITPAATAPASEETPIRLTSETAAHPVKHTQLFEGGDATLVMQAVDEEYVFGIDSARKTMKIKTPSGEVDAIVLTTDQLPYEEVDYNLNLDLPDFVNCWTDSISLTDVYEPSFNDRTKYIMNLFTAYQTMVVWRIIAKPPLFQAQQFWVGFNPSVKGTPASYNSANELTGFNWDPSKQNDIYVVTPWSSLDYVVAVTDLTQLGQLVITPRTSLITETDLPAPLQISVYSAPYKMKLFTPLPVTPDEVATEGLFFLQKTISGTGSFEVSGVGNVAASLANAQYLVNESGDYVITFGASQLMTHTDSAFGMAPVTRTGVATLAYDVPDTGTINLGFTSPSSFTVDSVDASKSPDTVYEEFDLDFPSTISGFNSLLITPTILPTANGAANAGGTENFLVFHTFDDGGSNSLIYSQPNPDSPATITGTNIDGSTFDVLTDLPVDVTYVSRLFRNDDDYERAFDMDGEEEMFSYRYDKSFKKNTEVYGKTFDHTPRLDNQFSLVSSKPLASTSDILTFDFLEPQEEFANFDRNRHLMFSKFPLLKLDCASNPSTNVLFRVTQKQTPDDLSLNECFQLPGFEWDPKDGAHVFQPYWTSPTPAETTDVADFIVPAYIQLNVLGGTVGTTAEVVMWYNTSTLEYHNMIGLDSTASSSNVNKPRKKRQSKKASEKTIFEIASLVEGGTEEMESGSISAASKVATLPSDGSVSTSEKRWNYVTSFKVPSDTSIISIPVNTRLLGPWAYKNAARHARWHGNMRVKVMVNNSMLANGNYHLIHANTHVSATDVVDTTKFIEVLGNIDHSAMGAPGCAAELELNWRVVSPKLAMDHTLNSADNGYLLICIPAFATPVTSSDIESIITIHSDSSALTYSLPRSTTYSGNYLPVEYVSASRI